MKEKIVIKCDDYNASIKDLDDITKDLDILMQKYGWLSGYELKLPERKDKLKKYHIVSETTVLASDEKDAEWKLIEKTFNGESVVNCVEVESTS